MAATTRTARTIPRELATPAFRSPEDRKPRTRAAKPSTPAPVAPARSAAPVPADNHVMPAQHNGVKVLREERISIGPNGSGKLKIGKLHLADGSTAFSCWDCGETAASRGDIVVHRNRIHGTRSGKKAPRVIYDRTQQADLFDVVLPPRPDGSPAPDAPVDMTIGEVLALAPTLKALGDMCDQLETENENLRVRLTETRVSKADQHKIDVYESNQKEIGELRAWKKAVTKKLEPLGFVLKETIEED